MEKINNKIRKTTSMQKAIYATVFILLLIEALFLLYPIYFALISSLKLNGRDFLNNMAGFPAVLNFANFVKAFNELEIANNSFFQMLLNSLWFSVGGTAISIFCSCITAYVVCRYKFVGKNFLYSLAIFIMIIPIVGALPAQYRLYNSLGLVNSPLILLTFTGGFGFNFVIIYAFFKSLPWSYAEAAFMDGAGHFRVFFTVMLPQAIGALVAISVMCFVGMYNDYMTPLLYLNKLPTLAFGLYAYERKITYTANHPVYFAGVIISMLPALILFAAFQNTVMESIQTGGLKG